MPIVGGQRPKLTGISCVCIYDCTSVCVCVCVCVCFFLSFFFWRSRQPQCSLACDWSPSQTWASHSPECLCGATNWTFLHSIRSCPLFELHRQQWLRRLGLQRMPQFGDAELLRWIFDPSIVINGRSAVNAHVVYVASVCQAARSLREG